MEYSKEQPEACLSNTLGEIVFKAIMKGSSLPEVCKMAACELFTQGLAAHDDDYDLIDARVIQSAMIDLRYTGQFDFAEEA